MNKFGKEFLELAALNNSLINFSKKSMINFQKNKKNFFINVVEFVFNDFDEKLLKNCYKIAIEKAKKTMNQNQAGKIREQKIKKINQFRGILAETIVHLYLHLECKLPLEKIFRYDLERTTFDYNPEEYDIKIILDSSIKELEIRSSHNPYFNLSRYLSNRGILCTYTNDLKQKEKVKDFSFAVIYDLLNYTGRLEDFVRENFCKDFKNHKYKIYLITHCATKKVYREFGEETNLGQGKTKYIQVPFYKISDEKFNIKNIIANLIKERDPQENCVNPRISC